MNAPTNTTAFCPCVVPDGRVGRFVALDDLDLGMIQLLHQWLTPVVGLDGHEYYDLAELGDAGGARP